ncbi:MAG TPA: DUF2304 domain-containing protein [Phycisphaerae bacterium]|nr:DUF2304 domain-containing protein [Phycisphaerae bacterium]
MILAELTTRAAEGVRVEPIRMILPLAAAGLISVVTIELIRRRKLREEYAMLWVAASAVLLVLAAFPRLFLTLSRLLDVDYRTTVMLIGFSFLSLMIIHLSVVASRGADDTRKTAQRVALLEERLERLQPEKQEADEPSGTDPG